MNGAGTESSSGAAPAVRLSFGPNRRARMADVCSVQL